MNFFDQVHETQITRYVRQPRISPLRNIPLHRRLFPVDAGQRAPARGR